MTELPNPFLNSPLEPAMAGETAAAPDLTDPPDAAAEHFSNPAAKATKGKSGTAGVNGLVRRSSAGTGLRVGESDADQTATSEHMDVTAGETAPNSRFTLDEAAFMDAIEPAPLFLSDPRPEYLDAIPDAVLAVLAGY